MPARSKSQARAMFAAAAGNSTLGIPKSVGREFTADQAPGSVKKLPQRAANKRINKLRKRGMISDRARQRMPMKYGDIGTNDVDATTT